MIVPAGAARPPDSRRRVLRHPGPPPFPEFVDLRLESLDPADEVPKEPRLFAILGTHERGRYH